MDRYSRITEKNPREIVLLRGSGCKWRRCRFCDYHLDFSSDEKANYRLNKQVLGQVEGIYSSLEVINSGSFCDLDEESIGEILQVCKDKIISRIHLECHWRDRETLSQFRSFFGEHGIQVTVKMGVETFDEVFRDGVLQKGMDHVKPQEIARYADEVCLLFGLTGQSEASMIREMETGLAFFNRVCVNLMTKNTSRMEPDPVVLDIFKDRIYPKYSADSRVDILLENTDFGVGGESRHE